jgi:hypothetical protein
VLLAALLAASAQAAAETFDLKVHAYCQQSLPSGTCGGFENEAQFRARQIQNIQGMNLRFCENGITFRPAGIDVTYDADISLISVANGAVDPDPATYGGSRVKELRDNVAAAEPGVEHMFVVEGLAGVGFAARPPDTKTYANEYYGLFIAPMFFGGGWAHEMGHHFGLSHTWTGDDPGIDRDGDNLACTADDPGKQEDMNTAGDGPADDVWSGVLRVGYEYCVESLLVAPNPNEPSAGVCAATCFVNPGGGQQFLPLSPPFPNVMSGYNEACHGPYPQPNPTALAFCSGQTATVQSILATIPERLQLDEVCGVAGDADCDGICQSADNCPTVANTSQSNTDSDLPGNACDNCASVSNPAQADLDDDGVGDACDANADGDCCAENVDDDDLDPTTRIGEIDGIGCPDQDLRGNGCLDSDNDGMPNCQDPNDDDDAALDESDGCPIDPSDVTGAACQIPVVCAQSLWWLACKFSGGGCLEFGLRLYQVVNPAPTMVFFRRFEIANQTLYVHPNPGDSVADVAAYFLGASAEGGEAGAAALTSGEWSLEIWTLDDLGNPRALREVVTTYQIADVVVTVLGAGALLAVTPSPGARGSLQLGSTWSPGLETGLLVADSDMDGVPAFLDLCTSVYDPAQRDSDGDAVGDACDPDLDNDGVVGASDIARFGDCLGTNLLVPAPALFDVPGAPATLVLPSDAEAAAAVRRSLCVDTDLTGDGQVNDADLAIAQATAGGPPGPSGFVSFAAAMVPGLTPSGAVLLGLVLATSAWRLGWRPGRH